MATCPECDGYGIIITCFDDICVGSHHCIHGDGEEMCPVCFGDGDVDDAPGGQDDARTGDPDAGDEYDPDACWLCVCGHYQTDGMHCACCGNEPPWGCDCGEHNDDDDDGEDDDHDFSYDYDGEA